jgi:hypothetical protein
MTTCAERLMRLSRSEELSIDTAHKPCRTSCSSHSSIEGMGDMIGFDNRKKARGIKRMNIPPA